MSDFFKLYLEYTKHNECPTFYHRWSGITALSAYLGRNIYFRFGHFIVHPNMYCMLIGSPGTKKSTAIKISAKLLKEAGYSTFAAKKTRQEKFLMDLSDQNDDGTSSEDDILDQNLWGDDDHSMRPPAETFVAADEFNNFIGIGNLDFMSILGELWDYEGLYDYKLKNSKSVYINDPTVTILGGNTPTGFSQAFPPEAIGQGFFSRLLMVYAEPTGVKITFPPPPDLEIQEALISHLHHIKETVVGEAKMTPEGIALLDEIYNTWTDIDDVRFEHYSNRRFNHLIKLCLVLTASRASLVITEEDVIQANTILTFTEHLMPKALGEFGKSRQSDTIHKVMQVIGSAEVPLAFKQIWKHVHSDLEKRDHLVEILGSLEMAEKIQIVEGGKFLPNKKERKVTESVMYDESYLTEQERKLL